MAITIDVRYSVNEKQEGLFSYDLKVEVLAATDMPEEIFIFQRCVEPAESVNTQPTDQFVCLADPVDLQEVPVNVPDPANEMPYYRTKEVLLRFRDMTTLTETKDLIAQDVQLLVDSLKAAATLTATEDVTYA